MPGARSTVHGDGLACPNRAGASPADWGASAWFSQGSAKSQQPPLLSGGLWWPLLSVPLALQAARPGASPRAALAPSEAHARSHACLYAFHPGTLQHPPAPPPQAVPPCVYKAALLPSPSPNRQGFTGRSFLRPPLVSSTSTALLSRTRLLYIKPSPVSPRPAHVKSKPKAPYVTWLA